MTTAPCERALKELFETEGYTVVLAANGRAALNRLMEGFRPSVVLLDLMMPVMDGWDFRTRRLREPALKDIPVFIITAAGFPRRDDPRPVRNDSVCPETAPHELLLPARVQDACTARAASA